MLLKVSGSGLSFLFDTGKCCENCGSSKMGNIHIFIPDGLHERLRRVCRHKVTQQKYLERVIEEALNKDESVIITKELKAPDTVDIRSWQHHAIESVKRNKKLHAEISDLLRGAESISCEGDVEPVTAHIDEGGDNVPVQYYVPEGEEK